eukprot:1183688-Prorocentrum_minimum.AAC.2
MQWEVGGHGPGLLATLQQPQTAGGQATAHYTNNCDEALDPPDLHQLLGRARQEWTWTRVGQAQTILELAEAVLEL